MYRVLDVSTSGYYAWLKRPVSERQQKDAVWLEHIRHFHKRSDGTYGVPRILIDLVEEGIGVSPKRIARLMHQAGLRGVCRRRSTRTTRRSLSGRPAADLVDREFTATDPNLDWLPVSVRCDGRLEPQDHRLSNGATSPHGSRPGCSRDGD